MKGGKICCTVFILLDIFPCQIQQRNQATKPINIQ